jgi:hypothetical protein
MVYVHKENRMSTRSYAELYRSDLYVPTDIMVGVAAMNLSHEATVMGLNNGEVGVFFTPHLPRQVVSPFDVQEWASYNKLVEGQWGGHHFRSGEVDAMVEQLARYGKVSTRHLITDSFFASVMTTGASGHIFSHERY